MPEIHVHFHGRRQRNTYDTDTRIKGFYAILTAKEGLLFGGVKVHTSSVFSSRQLAESWARQAKEVNEGAGRKVASIEIKEKMVSPNMIVS